MFLFKKRFSLKLNGAAVAMYLAIAAVLLSCKKDNNDDIITDPETPHFGWSPDFENHDYTHDISNDIFFGASNNLPSYIDLSDKLPPAGDQGSYGTCITWSLAYGLRTYMNAVSKNLIAPQLLEPVNQFSPADLWMSIPGSDRVGYCGGTSFQPAFKVLVTRGITNLQNAPYSSIKCSGQSSAEWAEEAAGYKIANYLMINKSDWSANTFKSYLAQHQVICFGARLGDKFRSWKSGVLSSDTYQQPTYHAMLLAGYDDSKGSSGAFKVFNSWGDEWGEKGYIWIDYDFFISDQFLNCAFAAVPVNEVTTNGNHETEDLVEGTDLTVVDVRNPEVHAGYGTNARIRFNVYNTGTDTVKSSKKWSIIFMYYNAYDAKDNGILAHFYYTDRVSGKAPFDSAPQSVLAGLQMPVENTNGEHAGECINQDIPPGKNIASVYYNNNQQYIMLDYFMPAVWGYYYLVMIVDPYNRINEVNEQNNTYIIARSDGIPYYFSGGVAVNMSN